MSGRLPESFIDELLRRVDIVDVIDRRVPLRKMGREFVARCPFHEEKTPSFTVSPQKQFYHCFGCGSHGSAIGFLMQFERIDFLSAVEELAHQARLELPRGTSTEAMESLEPIYTVLQQAAEYFASQLRQESGAAARGYLSQRGVSPEAVSAFMLGCAPDGWRNLCSSLGVTAERRRALAAAGLITENVRGEAYDRFRGRLMFPIRNRRGRVVGFGGRIVADGTPKYMNSPETVVFHKGRELYGLHEARRALRRIECLLVVEGYMDVVALAQFGIRNVVATLGTATSAQHLETLFRTTEEIVFCFDGDRAGYDAAWKALERGLAVARPGRLMRFLFLPAGDDPDTLVRREGREAFEARVRGAIPLSQLFFEHLGEDVDCSAPDGRAVLVERALPLLRRIPARVFRQLMLQELAGRVSMEAGRLERELGSTLPSLPSRGRAERPKSERRLSLVATAIAIFVQHPRLAGLGERLLDRADAAIPGVALLRELLELLRSQPTLSTGALVERWRGREDGRYLRQLASWQLSVPEGGLEAEVEGLINRLEERFAQRRAEQLLKRASMLTHEEKRELSHLLARLTTQEASTTP